MKSSIMLTSISFFLTANVTSNWKSNEWTKTCRGLETSIHGCGRHVRLRNVPQGTKKKVSLSHFHVYVPGSRPPQEVMQIHHGRLFTRITLICGAFMILVSTTVSILDHLKQSGNYWFRSDELDAPTKS